MAPNLPKQLTMRQVKNGFVVSARVFDANNQYDPYQEQEHVFADLGDAVVFMTEYFNKITITHDPSVPAT